MKSSNSIIFFLTITIVYVTSESTLGNKNKVMYNDGEIVVLTDPVIDPEVLGAWNEDIDLNKFIPPISDSVIKCLMHVDRYCSPSMAHTKGLLIKALRDDCENCTIMEKESVGKIVASMWAYDSQLWKLFLKRFDSNGSVVQIVK